MENKYKELFEKIAPKKSDEELLRAVLDRKAVNMSEKKRFNKKAIIIPAAAAAVLLCTTVGVSAAYEWNLSAALSDIFDKSSKKAPDDVTFKDFNFQTIGGKELNDVIKFTGYEVQLKGVSADPHNMLLFYDVVLDDENITFKKDEGVHLNVRPDPVNDLEMIHDYYLRPNAAGTEDDPAMMSPEERAKLIDGGGGSRTLSLGTEGNVAHFCYRSSMGGMDFVDKEIKLEFQKTLYKYTADDGYPFLDDPNDENQLYTVKLDFIDASSTIDFKPDAEIALLSGYTGTVTHVQISPLSVMFRVSWGDTPVEWKHFEDEETDPNAIDGEEIYKEFKIKLKDGTVMDTGSFLSWEDGADRSLRSHGHRYDDDTIVMEYSQDCGFEWLYPVNASDVEALIIGNTTIPVN